VTTTSPSTKHDPGTTSADHRKERRPVAQRAFATMLDRCKWMVEPFFLHNVFLYFLGKRLFRVCPALLPHESDYHAVRTLLAGRDGLFVDIGANDGVSALSFRAVTRGVGNFQILSIEPNPVHARTLQRIRRSDPRYSFRIVAVGDRRAELTLAVPSFCGFQMSSAASLSHAHRELFESCLSRFFRTSLRYREYKVEVIPLDELRLTPIFMKVDAEGFDAEVLRGAERTLTRCEPILMCEYNINNIVEMTAILESHRYALFRYVHAQRRFLRYRGEPCRNFFALPRPVVLALGANGILVSGSDYERPVAADASDL
jgi:FkbM family methyltransferase